MKSTTVLRHLALIALWFFVVSCQTPQPAPPKTSPLFDYVLKQDPAFQYEVVHTSRIENSTFYVVRMTSQQWLTSKEISDTTWWHWVTMVVPDEYNSSTGMMWIGGGTKDDPMPTQPDGLIWPVSHSTNSVVASVHNVPFQPIMFPGDTVKRYEDAIIAYGWRKFLEGGARDEDARWLSRLPMTKAVTSAMDVVQKVLLEKKHHPIDSFFVAGASKRGWTTWTTAAVDKRVVAIAPVVIDLLNLVPSFEHHYRNYGFWAPAVTDYVNEGIMDWMGSKEFDRMLQIVEPYSYRKLYMMPKLLINASGDQFFQPDSWKFYYDSLPTEKHLMYVPNSGHDVSRSDALQNLTAFYATVLNKSPRPRYQWSLNKDEFVITTDSIQPIAVKLWQAHNAETRDFRIDAFGDHWSATTLPIASDGTYHVKLDTPEKGWTGYFVELTFPGQIPFKVTTGVEVLPHRYPFEAYKPAGPMGSRQ